MDKENLIIGGAILAFVGLVYYQWSTNKNKRK